MTGFLTALVALPGSALLTILSLIGLASWPRQIIRVLPKNPAKLALLTGRTRDGPLTGDADGEKDTSLGAWVNEKVPSLKGSFTPSWWLPNGHLQTIFSVIGNFTNVDKVLYRRTYLRTPDGGTLGLDFTPVETHHADDTPMVVVCHGLTGGSHESYVRNVLSWVVKPVADGGMGGRAVVVNFRGCAGVPVTSTRLYSAGTTADLGLALHYLRHLYPSAPLHGIGFSLGASVLARYLGETGEDALVSSGIVLGCPWNLPGMSIKLEGDFFTRHVYSQAMATNLVKLFTRHYDADSKALEQDEHFKDACIPALLKLKGKRVIMRDVDNVLTSQLGGPKAEGYFPFKDASEYYEWASSDKLLVGVKRPMLAINAFDDPIIDAKYLPVTQVESSSHVYLAVTGGGGHLGWFDGPLLSSVKSKQRWILKPASEWLSAAVKDFEASAEISVDKDEKGWHTVIAGGHEIQGGGERGWRVLDESEIVQGEEESGVLQGL